jgi:hypothetical protein
MEDKINSFFKGAGSALRSFTDGVKKNIVDIQVDTVVNAINSMNIRKTIYTTEKKVEDFVCAELDSTIGKAHSQYNIGGYLGLRVDIDLGDGQVGIELKLAKELSAANNIERLFGQVIYYSKRVYKDKLIVVVVGTDKEYTQIIREVEKFITEIGVTFVYKRIQ